MRLEGLSVLFQRRILLDFEWLDDVLHRAALHPTARLVVLELQLLAIVKTFMSFAK